MRKINHLVFKNGKLIRKEEADQLDKLEKQRQLTIAKPIASIVSTGEPIHDTISIMKATYQTRISKLQHIISQLQQQLDEKNRIINQLQHSHFQKNLEESAIKLKLGSEKSYRQSINTRESLGCLTDRSNSSTTNQQEIIIPESIQETKKSPEGSNFDSSNLMKRLTHSENLVNTVKQFLGKRQDQFQIKANKATENQQVNQFIEEMMMKHASILELLEKLQSQQQREIEEISDHYQAIISQITKQSHSKSAKTSRVIPWKFKYEDWLF